MIAISTSSMTQANGNAPVKMWDSVIDGSRMVLLMVKHNHMRLTVVHRG